MITLIDGASEIITCSAQSPGAIGPRPRDLRVITDGALAVEGDRIVDIGPSQILRRRHRGASILSASGRLVSPGLVDAHTHLVHAGSRHHEYEGLLSSGDASEHSLASGIHYTVRMTRQATTASLRRQALADLDVMLAHGTTTVEAKSGYGLDRVTELRLLRVMSTLHHPAEVVPTYLALHVPPAGGRGRREPYIDMTLALLDEARNMAEYCDVCCDPIGFSRDECAAVGTRAKELGYRIKLHADQTGWSGGAELASELKATSADHLDAVSANGIRAMANAGTVAVLLPAVSFHLLPLVTTGTETPDNFSRLRKLPSLVRELMHQGATVAIASDYNPGTAPTPSMQTAMRVAARLYRIDYPTVWQMATLNAARALDRDRDRGSLEIGKRADLVIWSVAEHGLVIHRFGTNLVDTVMKDGIVVVESGRPTYR